MARLSPLVARISGPASATWEVSDRAFTRMRKDCDIIHLGVGDPDLDTSPSICAALGRALSAGRTHYSPLAGEPALRAAIAAHAEVLYGGNFSPDRVAVCSGAQGALFATFQCIAGPDDEIIVLEPFYATYPAAVAAGGARMVTVALDAATGYQIDIKRITAAITSRTVAILVNSPCNPSGAVFTQTAMNTLASLCHARDIWLVSDEVYWSLCYDGPHASPMRAQAARDNVIAVNSLSKSHAMTGWRIGWAIGPEPFVEALTTLAQSLYFGINQFVQDAAVTAVSDPDAAAKVHNTFRARRDALVAALGQTDAIRFPVPHGGMFLLLDVSATGQDGRAFAEDLLDTESVAVVPGLGFGDSLAHTVRVGFLGNPARLEEAARRIIRYAKGLM